MLKVIGHSVTLQMENITAPSVWNLPNSLQAEQETTLI